ncbi:MAG: hypothetical protein ACRDFB_02015, partial [Rhabdochlamydiaceae bacterium]
MIFLYKSTTPAVLQSQLKTEAADSWDVTTQALAYLSSHVHPALEATLNEKLNAENITSLASHLIKTSPQLLDTYLKVLSLDLLKSLAHIENVQQHAADEACFMPKPTPTTLGFRIASSLALKPGIVSKVVTYVASLLSWSYSIDLDNPPRTYWNAQSQWMFFRNMITDVQWVGTTLFAYFVKVKKT